MKGLLAYSKLLYFHSYTLSLSRCMHLCFLYFLFISKEYFLSANIYVCICVQVRILHVCGNMEMYISLVDLILFTFGAQHMNINKSLTTNDIPYICTYIVEIKYRACRARII